LPLLCHMCAPSRPLHFFFFTAPATTEIYPLSLHDALPISTQAPPNVRGPGAKFPRASPCLRVRAAGPRARRETSSAAVRRRRGGGWHRALAHRTDQASACNRSGISPLTRTCDAESAAFRHSCIPAASPLPCQYCVLDKTLTKHSPSATLLMLGWRPSGPGCLVMRSQGPS